MSEYDVPNEISDELSFNWWVKENLKHIYRIISKVKSKYWRTSHKFGIRVPKTVKKYMILIDNQGLTFAPRPLRKR